MPDYTFTIKTPAELAGVEQAIARFERLRGQAKANGQDFAALDAKIAAARASIEAFHASQVKLAESTAKVADESARYQATLQRMAAATNEAADADALAALKAEALAKVTARKQVELEETIYAQAELSNLTKSYSQQEVDALLATGTAHDTAGKAAEKHEANARKVDKAFGALAAAGGPVGQTLNQLRELAASPLTLSLAGLSIVVGIIAAKFREWRAEIQETRARMMELQWGRLDGFRTALVNATTAQQSLNTALAAAGKDQDAIGTAYQQRATLLDAELERKKNLLKLNEELEVSNARAAGGTDKDEANIRARYAAVRASGDTQAAATQLQQLRSELAQREERQPGLVSTAQSSRAAADQFARSQPVLDATTQLGLAESKARQLRDKFTQAGGDAELASMKGIAEMPNAAENFPLLVIEYQKLKKLKEQVDAANADLFGAQGQVKANTNRQQQLETAAGTAQNAATSNADAITGLRTRIGTTAAVNQVQAGQRLDELAFGRGPAGKLVLDAAAGADAITGGGSATPEQAQAINAAAKALGLQNVGVHQLLDILGKMNDTQEYLLRSIDSVQARQNQINADAANRQQQSYNR